MSVAKVNSYRSVDGGTPNANLRYSSSDLLVLDAHNRRCDWNSHTEASWVSSTIHGVAQVAPIIESACTIAVARKECNIVVTI